MAVARVHHDANYTCISNSIFRNKNLSLKAKGLLCLMLSLPDGWDYSIKGLATLNSDGETSVRNTIKELEEHRYVVRKRVYENGKIADWEYHIYETPVEQDDLDVENLTQGTKDNKVINNQVSKKQNKKSISKDILEPGSSSTSFNFGKSSSTKENKIKTSINDVAGDNKELQELLYDFLGVHREAHKGTVYINSWLANMRRLKEWMEEGKDPIEIVNYSILKGYPVLYENGTTKDTKKKLDINSNRYVGKQGNYNLTDKEKAPSGLIF